MARKTCVMMLCLLCALLGEGAAPSTPPAIRSRGAKRMFGSTSSRTARARPSPHPTFTPSPTPSPTPPPSSSSFTSPSTRVSSTASTPVTQAPAALTETILPSSPEAVARALSFSSPRPTSHSFPSKPQGFTSQPTLNFAPKQQSFFAPQPKLSFAPKQQNFVPQTLSFAPKQPSFNPQTLSFAPHPQLNPVRQRQVLSPSPSPVTRQRPNKQVHIPIVALKFNLREDGSYTTSSETGDGTVRQERGDFNGAGMAVQGMYAYRDSNQGDVQVNYVADEYGFQPQGPNIHPAILQAVAEQVKLARSAKSRLGAEGLNGIHDEDYDEEPKPKSPVRRVVVRRL